MTKNSKTRIQKSEENILSFLKNKANASDFCIAKKLECSRQKIWRIRKTLEDSKIIWGYSVVVDQRKRERKEFVILFKRSEELMDEKCAHSLIYEQLGDIIENEKIEIDTIMCIYGLFDLYILLNAPNVMAVKSFISNIRRSWGKYFDNIIMLESLQVLKKNSISNPEILEKEEFLTKLL